MAYTKHTWVEQELITSDKLNNIEGGVDENQNNINNINDDISNIAVESNEQVVKYDLLPYAGYEFTVNPNSCNYTINNNNVTLVGNVVVNADLDGTKSHAIFENLPFLFSKRQSLLVSAGGLTTAVLLVDGNKLTLSKFINLSNPSNTTIAKGSILAISSTWSIDLEYIEQIGNLTNGSQYWRADLPNTAIDIVFAHDELENTLPRVKLETPVQYSIRKNTSFLVNGGRFLPDDSSTNDPLYGRPQGTTYVDGKTYTTWNDEYSENIGLDKEGYLHRIKQGSDISKIPKIDKSVTGFYAIIEDGELLPIPDHNSDHDIQFQRQPRSIIYQKYNKDFGVVVIGGNNINNSVGATFEEMQEFISGISDVKFAFVLDGGGSASFVKYNTMLNPSFDTKVTTSRPMTDFITFTAKVN